GIETILIKNYEAGAGLGQVFRDRVQQGTLHSSLHGCIYGVSRNTCPRRKRVSGKCHLVKRRSLCISMINRITKRLVQLDRPKRNVLGKNNRRNFIGRVYPEKCIGVTIPKKFT